MIDLETALAAIRTHGVAHLPRAFPKEALLPLVRAADSMVAAPFSFSVRLSELPDSGEPCNVDGLYDLIVAVMDEPVACDRDQSWLRKRFAPVNAPPHYLPNTWHQDGGLGVTYPAQPDPPLPMTRLLTLWIPLRACGTDAPGLEFVRRPLDQLLHYTELDDARLRHRFPPEMFWAPDVGFGDALLFLPGTLHRTHAHPGMTHDRCSVEYRFFPSSGRECS